MKYLFSLLTALLLAGCGSEGKAFVPNRVSDWEKDGLNGPVLTRTTLVYAMLELSESNQARPVQKIIDEYSPGGDKQSTKFINTPFYAKLQVTPYAAAKTGDYKYYDDSALIYDYQKREGHYFISSRYTNFQKPDVMKWEQEWVFSEKGIPIGESFYKEDKSGMESYFLEFIYNDKGVKIKEEYSGEYQGKPEAYTSIIQCDSLGRETNRIQVIGNITNRSRIVYNINGKILKRFEIEGSMFLFAAEVYDFQGHIISRTIVDNEGEKAVYKYYYDYDGHDNIIRSWATVATRKNRFAPVLSPLSYQTITYRYGSKK